MLLLLPLLLPAGACGAAGHALGPGSRSRAVRRRGQLRQVCRCRCRRRALLLLLLLLLLRLRVLADLVQQLGPIREAGREGRRAPAALLAPLLRYPPARACAAGAGGRGFERLGICR